MTQECRQFRVEGLVQGVFFRANTEQVATSMGLVGFVRNTDDGAVEGVACGPTDVLDAFEKWLHLGSDASRVDKVDSQKIDYQVFKSFDIRY